MEMMARVQSQHCDVSVTKATSSKATTTSFTRILTLDCGRFDVDTLAHNAPTTSKAHRPQVGNGGMSFTKKAMFFCENFVKSLDFSAIFVYIYIALEVILCVIFD